MNFAVGSLVRARDREWVVLPESQDEEDVLVLRPLGGTEDEVTGIYTPLEPVEPAEFQLPDPDKDMGDHLSCGLLRNAVRLGFRSGAGPFRSLAKIGIDPRPYQFVPLLMALRLNPIRLLIADDVGVGKTVEACLIAREMLDRGEIRRMAVLCPPHLADQWQRALHDQFHIDAVLVLSGTAARLEREIPFGGSIFDQYPFTVVSTDYIKSERRRHEFLRSCPEFVMVDEAHTCASAGMGRSAQQRHELLKELVKDEERHLVLVTATPHSGNDETFRSLLGLVNRDFLNLPNDLSGEKNRPIREHLAQHLVQRRRPDLRAYMDTETPFPDREIAEEHYSLTPEYRKFFDRVLDYCRESVLDESLDKHRQRIRWWSALALLRALASSPRVAAATLRNRAASADTVTVEEADEVGRRTVLDQDDETAEGVDVVAGSQTEEEETGSDRDRLLRFARKVEKLEGKPDRKLSQAGQLVDTFLKDGFSPIIFCRFIPTVEYVAETLRKKLGKNVAVEAITGNLPPEERERRVEALGAHPKRVLVCTDCLSEGINLQHHFDAVMHYDLSWNPTRHEQREGRVDRYGQEKDQVRTLTYYGEDNPVDGIVLEVLLRKHKAIHQQLGITVPVPMDTNVVVEAIFEGLLLREFGGSQQLTFDFLEPQREEVEVQWDAAVDQEKRSRTIFAQRTIRVDKVAKELEEARRVLGDEHAVASFTTTTLKALNANVSGEDPVTVDLAEVSGAVREAIGQEDGFKATFSGRMGKGLEKLTRTHPIVEGLSAYVLETALDTEVDGPGKRCGVIWTKAVKKRTTVLLLRLRYHIVTRGQDGVDRPLLAEDHALIGFSGSAEDPEWLEADVVEALLEAQPDRNVAPELAKDQLAGIISNFDGLRGRLNMVAEERGEALLDAHLRVRQSARLEIRALRVEPHLPPDVLGIFLYRPMVGGVA